MRLRTLRINILLLSVVMLFSINVSYADVETIDNIKVKSLISKGIPLIDIRSSNEWKETGIIEGSHLITFFNEKGKVNLNKWMSAFYKVADKTKPFMLICASGVRSKFASYILNNQFDIPKIYDASEGVSGWIKDKHPVVKNY